MSKITAFLRKNSPKTALFCSKGRPLTRKTSQYMGYMADDGIWIFEKARKLAVFSHRVNFFARKNFSQKKGISCTF